MGESDGETEGGDAGSIGGVAVGRTGVSTLDRGGEPLPEKKRSKDSNGAADAPVSSSAATADGSSRTSGTGNVGGSFGKRPTIWAASAASISAAASSAAATAAEPTTSTRATAGRSLVAAAE